MNFQGMEPRCGYIDTEGREVLPAKWDDAGEFSEMRAPVMRFGVNSEDFYDARWGYIATNGQLVVCLLYTSKQNIVIRSFLTRYLILIKQK